jgi:Holliday junction resolvasome RuvABC endonuclease subunit
MITLGLDPSLTGFGWCVHDSAAVGPSRIIAKGVFETSSKTVFIERYVALRDRVGSLLDQYLLVEAVGVESPTYGELWSAGAYGLFLMVTEAIWVRRRDVVYFDPVTVKMLAKEDPSVRKGKMFKSDMVDACRADTGLRGRLNHNEADAYHIARFAARFWMLLKGQIQEEELTPSEYQSFAKIHTFSKGKRVGQTIEIGAMFKENRRFFWFSKLEKS